MNETKKPLRCPLGVPGGVIAALIALVGVVVSILQTDWFQLGLSLALLLIAMPFVRVTMMVHSANDRLDAIEEKMKEK
ncbi:hypothetical protein [Tenuifilum thalassicum]|uniref:Uncharacterized protein n=1 Tax=Tenuifilum thalassicum TaxID=2590900 RepID=A0A7D4C8L0_9BACT|nr:hypothetical protein [Tenuifilum thalassicum]QKG79642.1 hypothetical protein FHG85_04995 [Tenuifilum thalassicum]